MKPWLALFALAFGTAPLHAAIDPKTLSSLSFHQHPGAQLPPGAELISATGQKTSLAAALGGKPAILILEYLRCKTLCSLVLSGAVQAITASHLEPGRDLSLIAISIDPRETPADAAAAQSMYEKRFPDPLDAAKGVRFFIASPAEVRGIASVIGFPYRYDRATDQFAHPAGFVVTTPTARISRYMLGLSPDPASLKQAIVEASHDEVRPAVHPLLLLCFGYDPDEGTAAALAMKLVRIASLGVILACALLITFLSLRRRPA